MAYEIICAVCRKKFSTHYGHVKCCSNECKTKRINEMRGVSEDTSIAPGTVGAISELMVASDLMKKGYAVFRALSPACYCDLIASKDDNMILVEVRTGYRALSGGIIFPTHVQKNVNIFGIYIRKTNEVVYFRRKAGILYEDEL